MFGTGSALSARDFSTAQRIEKAERRVEIARDELRAAEKALEELKGIRVNLSTRNGFMLGGLFG